MARHLPALVARSLACALLLALPLHMAEAEDASAPQASDWAGKWCLTNMVDHRNKRWRFKGSMTLEPIDGGYTGSLDLGNDDGPQETTIPQDIDVTILPDGRLQVIGRLRNPSDWVRWIPDNFTLTRKGEAASGSGITVLRPPYRGNPGKFQVDYSFSRTACTPIM